MTLACTFRSFELWYAQRYLDLPKPGDGIWLVYTDHPRFKNDLKGYAQFLVIKEEFADEISQGHFKIIEGEFCQAYMNIPLDINDIPEDVMQCLEKAKNCIDSMDAPEYWKAKYDELLEKETDIVKAEEK